MHEAEGGPTARALITQVLRKRVLNGLGDLYDLKLVGKNLPVLTTNHQGFQPSADFLAFNHETGTLFLAEVKRSPKTERELVTELSAYSGGLGSRVFGLSVGNGVVWLPICIDWKTTALAAITYASIWRHTPCVPLRLVLHPRTAKPRFHLEVVDPSLTVKEEVASALFSWASFDGLTVFFSKAPSDPRVFVDFVAAAGARLGLSGFVLYSSSNLGDYYPHPFGLTIGTFNPFKGALKTAQLRRVKKLEGRRAMRKAVKEDLWSWLDIDLRTGKTFKTEPEHLVSPPQGAVSVRHFADFGSTGVSALWKELKPRIEGLAGSSYELGGPSILRLLTGTAFHMENAIDDVAYFGIMQEAVYERLLWEFAHAKNGDGPIIGDVGGDPLRAYSSMSFWVDFMELMNWEHSFQPTYNSPCSDDAADSEDC